jgi:hypothetical protein
MIINNDVISNISLPLLWNMTLCIVLPFNPHNSLTYEVVSMVVPFYSGGD